MKKGGIVSTASGRIRGYDDAGVAAFKGIPYAAPPVGSNRFRPAEPVKPWTDVLDALEFGPVAPQPESPPELSAFQREQSEADCLTLNIWTPDTDDKKRPVLFWIHGGSLVMGSGADFNGQRLAARGDVVVVSINYRLGLFGFLYVPNMTANVGLLDQVQALKWIKKNVGLFGGDPSNITIFGESAGSTSVSALMTMPAAKGLFKRAIMQSSACYSFAHKPEGGEAVAGRIFSILGIQYGDLEALRAVSAEKLIETYQKAMEGSFLRDSYPPFADGDVLPMNPLEAIQKGLAGNIELLAGTNENEGSLWSLWDPNIDKIDDKELHRRFQSVLGEFGQDENTVKEFLHVYTEETSKKLLTERRSVYEAFATDYMFRIPVRRYLEEQSVHQPDVYSYLFSWKTPEMEGKLGATHALEIPFVIGTLSERAVGIFPKRTAETDKLSFNMMDAWLNFARCGDPNHKNIPNWPAYDVNQRATMVFDNEIRVETGLFSRTDEAWQGII